MCTLFYILRLEKNKIQSAYVIYITAVGKVCREEIKIHNKIFPIIIPFAFKIWYIPSNYVIMFVGSVLMNRFEIYFKKFENIIHAICFIRNI